MAFQKGIKQGQRQAARDARRQDTEQRPARRDPAQRLPQDLRAQSTTDQIANRESGEGTILVEIGTEHCPSGPDTEIGKRRLKPCRWQMDNRNRVADQRQRCAHALERLRLVSDGEVASLSTRSRPQLWQVNRQPLLQIARGGRCNQGRTRRPAADVDQQTRPIRLRTGAGERRRGCL